MGLVTSQRHQFADNNNFFLVCFLLTWCIVFVFVLVYEVVCEIKTFQIVQKNFRFKFNLTFNVLTIDLKIISKLLSI